MLQTIYGTQFQNGWTWDRTYSLSSLMDGGKIEQINTERSQILYGRFIRINVNKDGNTLGILARRVANNESLQLKIYSGIINNLNSDAFNPPIEGYEFVGYLNQISTYTYKLSYVNASPPSAFYLHVPSETVEENWENNRTNYYYINNNDYDQVQPNETYDPSKNYYELSNQIKYVKLVSAQPQINTISGFSGY